MSNANFPIVALIGRPNVGKSTLFNRLTRSRKAIVDPTPGVTRDRHYEEVHWADRGVILVDTGGIEIGPQEQMASLIVEQTLQAVQEADLLVFILDGRTELTAEDHKITELLRRSAKPIFFVINKLDNPGQEEKYLPTFYELGVDRLWPISAEHGYGVHDFMDALVAELPQEEEKEGLPKNVIRVACVGRPNVGKSSLVNRLLGQERMIVSEIPGTTRDSVDTLLTLQGQDYLLIDTAGIRRKGKVAGVEK